MGDETIHDQIVQQHHTDEFVLNCDAVDIFVRYGFLEPTFCLPIIMILD